MKLFISIVNKSNNIIGGIAGLFMILSVLLVLTEVVIRTVFNGTIYITTEFTAYFLVSITFLGLGYTLKEKGHIRLGFLHQLVKNRKFLFIAELYAYLMGL